MPRDFPFEACRDLLGLLRAVFAAEKRRRPPNARKLRTLELAWELQQAVTLAATHDAGTAPYARALGMADAAARRLGDVFELTDPVMPVLEAAGKPVRPRRRAAERAGWASERRRKGGG